MDKNLNDKPHVTTNMPDGLQMPEFFRVTEDEHFPNGKTAYKASKLGELEGFFWLPQMGKKGGKYYICELQRTDTHQLVHIFCPVSPSVDYTFLEMVYIRNIFWGEQCIVTEIYPSIAQYGDRKTSARTLARFYPKDKPLIHTPKIIVP